MKAQFFLADQSLSELTPDQIESLPVYQGKLMLGRIVINILDYLTWMTLCEDYTYSTGPSVRLEISPEALAALKEEVLHHLQPAIRVNPRGETSTLDYLEVLEKPMPRWNHDGLVFTPNKDGQYEDAILTWINGEDKSITIRFAR